MSSSPVPQSSPASFDVKPQALPSSLPTDENPAAAARSQAAQPIMSASFSRDTDSKLSEEPYEDFEKILETLEDVPTWPFQKKGEVGESSAPADEADAGNDDLLAACDTLMKELEGPRDEPDVDALEAGDVAPVAAESEVHAEEKAAPVVARAQLVAQPSEEEHETFSGGAEEEEKADPVPPPTVEVSRPPTPPKADVSFVPSRPLDVPPSPSPRHSFARMGHQKPKIDVSVAAARMQDTLNTVRTLRRCVAEIPACLHSYVTCAALAGVDRCGTVGGRGTAV